MATVAKCVRCGELKGFSKDRWEKNISKYGSLENLNSQYLCRTCRPKTIKATKTPETIEAIDAKIAELVAKRDQLDKVIIEEVKEMIDDGAIETADLNEEVA